MIKKFIANLTDHIKEHGKKSCRKLAEIFHTSKSSIDRQQQKVKARAHIPGASFLESEEGQQWLLRLIVATIFVFGIMAGIGAERISLFFTFIYASSFVAVSSSSIHKIENIIDDLIGDYKNKYDEQVKNKATSLEITPGGDETFFDNLMLLVLMDLNSGFIFVEKAEEKRDHKTWESNSMSWMSKFKVVRCFLSDKAKALLKFAEDSLGVNRIPDLFHMMNDISSVMKFSFHRLKKSTEKSINCAKKQLAKGVEVTKNKAIMVAMQATFQMLLVGQITYQRNYRKLSTSLHPFAILSAKPQTSSEVDKKMQASLSKIKEIREQFEISDPQKKFTRVGKQIPDAAKLIDLWWHWAKTSLDSADITPELKDWLLHYLLPYIYWSNQPQKTQSKKIKRFYKLSIKISWEKLQAHSLTPLMCNADNKNSQWIEWAQKITKLFLRTTSAIEGRNGWLSQIHFNGRGLSEKRIISQTAIHNYELKRADGTTACERLSGIKPESLFEHIMDNIGPLSIL